VGKNHRSGALLRVSAIEEALARFGKPEIFSSTSASGTASTF